MEPEEAEGPLYNFFNDSACVASTDILKKVTWPSKMSVGVRKHPHSGKNCKITKLKEETDKFIIRKERRIENSNPIYHNAASHYCPVERKFITASEESF